MQARIHTLFLGSRLFRSTLLASLALAGCGREEATAPAQAHVSSYDLSFITNLYNVVEFDRQVIGQELARTRIRGSRPWHGICCVKLTIWTPRCGPSPNAKGSCRRTQ